jgi:uncharacterized protein involved in high-affinity Fe2+ transport
MSVPQISSHLVLSCVLACAGAVPACVPAQPSRARPEAQSPARARRHVAPMTTASRASGFAPLAVFFDAVDTTPEGKAWPFAWKSGVKQPADMEGAHFEWEFGDAGAGTWPHTGRSRNAATGYTAAHVFEEAGQYRVTLTVT